MKRLPSAGVRKLHCPSALSHKTVCWFVSVGAFAGEEGATGMVPI